MDFNTVLALLIVPAFLILIVLLAVFLGLTVSQEKGDTSAQIKLLGVITGNARVVMILGALGILSVLGLRAFGVVEKIHAKKSEPSRQQLKAPVDETSEKVLEVEVGISPKSQIIKLEDFKKIDRDKEYINEEFGIAMAKLSKIGDWEIVENIDSVPSVGYGDIPIAEGFFNANKAFYYSEERFPILGVLNKKEVEIILDKDSTIDSIPMYINPYIEHPGIIKSMMENLQSEWDDKFKLTDFQLWYGVDRLAKSTEGLLAKNVPRKKIVRSGIYIVEIPKNFFDKSFFGRIAPSITLLDNIFGYISMSGKFTSASLKRLSIDQEDGIASFNGSVDIQKVKINGENKYKVTVNNIGFIIAGKNYGKYVKLISISPPDNMKSFEEIKKILKSLKFLKN